MNILKLLTIASTIFLIVACSSKNQQFTVEGKITDADSSIIYLEKRDLDEVNILDSSKLNNKGEFKFKNKASTYPEFYILRLNNQVINLAIDSTETIRIESNKKDFATNYKIEGSIENQQIQKVVYAQNKADHQLTNLRQLVSNKKLTEEQYLDQIQNILNEYRNTAQEIIYANFGSSAAYFALFQKIENHLFFDVYDKKDNKLFGAVATSWDQKHKDSPRSKQLKDYTLIAMKGIKQNSQTISENIINSASEIKSSDYYKIELPDTKDQIISLASLKGKVVILDFSLYSAEKSPAHNIALNKIYNEFNPNIEIYQVAFDPDLHLWKNAAINLPWITVHESKSVDSELFSKFNIQGLPTIFLLNKNGEIIKRILSTDDLEAEIRAIN